MPNLHVIRFLFIVLIASIFQLDAQAQKLKELVKNGQKAMADKDYYSASIYFNKALLKDSSDISIQYNYAEASRLNYDYPEAERWYDKVFKKDNGKQYPEALFWLAELKKANGKYKEAKKLYDRFSKKYKKKNPVMTAKALQQKESCDLAQLLIKDSLKIKMVHLNDKVNTNVSEYAPIEKDSVLYFSSLRSEENHSHINKLYQSKKDSVGNWQMATVFDSTINVPGVNTANGVFNKDGSVMYFTRCEQLNSSEFRCKLYQSSKRNGTWGQPKLLSGEVNKGNNTFTQPAVGKMNDKDVLFFSSNIAGGKGGMDLYYCYPDSNGFVNEIINAGVEVNSVEDDITPFFCTPCQKIYFSSTWHQGIGGFDIFESHLVNGKFTKPVNVGYPINSRYNDIYFSVADNFMNAYLSSNRPGSFFEEKATCCNDIYSFPIPGRDTMNKPEPVDSTKLMVNQMKLLVPLTLYFHNDEPDAKTNATSTNKNYETTYRAYIDLLDKYRQEYSKGLVADEKGKAITLIDEFFEDSVTAGMEDLRKFALLLEQVLIKGEKVEITMMGFCSPLASTDYNKNLARRRTSSLRNYFREYKNGMFIPYMDDKDGKSAQMQLKDVGVGELEKSVTSDNPNDQKNSVYSRAAAVERKIQIIAFSTETFK